MDLRLWEYEFISIRFDAMAEQMRGAVLDNTFMGGQCTIEKQGPNRKYYRIPANIEKFNIKVGFCVYILLALLQIICA